MTAPHLQAHQLVWHADNKAIIDQISFAQNKGETVGIVGPNGAGKTSLLKCLYGEHVAKSGEVLISGEKLVALSRKQLAQKVAVVGQHYDSVFNLTVIDIVKMGLIPHKSHFDLNTDADRAIIDSALKKVNLLDKQFQCFNTLSGGEQQRCLIARAIVQRPEILIMDEPTNHLDVYYQHQILSLSKALGFTVLMTIHDLNLAAQYCDRILLMANGKQLAFDTPKNVLQQPLLEQVFKLPCMIDVHPLTQKVRVSFGGVS